MLYQKTVSLNIPELLSTSGEKFVLPCFVHEHLGLKLTSIYLKLQIFETQQKLSHQDSGLGLFAFEDDHCGVFYRRGF